MDNSGRRGTKDALDATADANIITGILPVPPSIESAKTNCANTSAEKRLEQESIENTGKESSGEERKAAAQSAVNGIREILLSGDISLE